ncbi:hypothetical protein [Streptomyces sp. enrichment culture]|uniref:hypothetical protein n=1 Tax=Streptomyces sp. enrichment culture TaxID=1795815 RepID=UPI003F579015
MVEVVDLVGEALERAFGQGDQADGVVEAAEGDGGAGEGVEVVEVGGDVVALLDLGDLRDEPDSGVGSSVMGGASLFEAILWGRSDKGSWLCRCRWLHWPSARGRALEEMYGPAPAASPSYRPPP